MIPKNVYLAFSVILFIPLIILYFQNITFGTFIVFFSNMNGSMAVYFWPLMIIAWALGATVTLYIQKFFQDMDADSQAGGLNL